MVVEKECVVLGEMNIVDFYVEGCDEIFVIIVFVDVEECVQVEIIGVDIVMNNFVFVFEFSKFEFVVEVFVSIDVFMFKEFEDLSKVVFFQLMEGIGESFEFWESGSNKDEIEVVELVVFVVFVDFIL